jgi:hypothetical protein
MKLFFSAIFIATSIIANAQQHKLTMLWQTDTIVAVPESVLPDAGNKVLYVSLIDGGPWDEDGKGGVAQLSTDNKKYNPRWITGLNAPKGLGQHGNRLYVANISNVVVIDIAKGKIEKKIAIEQANGLNDITITSSGVVYVSDSKNGKIYRIEKDVPALYLDNISGVNGLKSIKDDLFIGGGQSFLKADSKKQITKVAQLPESIDGIEPIGNGDFLVTSWVGYIYYVHANGTFETLLDTHLEKKNTADIGYDARNKIVYVPTFNAKRVVAYKLQ